MDALVTIVGAGLAGGWLAHELVARGRRVRLLERGSDVAAGASGNAAGIIKPVVSRQPSRPEAFYRAAFAHLRDRLADPRLSGACGLQRSGALQLVRKPFPHRPGAESIDAQEASRRAGLPLPAPALSFDEGAWLNPSALCHALIEPLRYEPLGCESPGGEPPGRDRSGFELVLGATLVGIAPLAPGVSGWTLTLDDGSTRHTDQVVLANGPAAAALPACAHLPITAARGQMDRFARGDLPLPRTVVTGRSWLIPDGDALWAGATYTREDAHDGLRAADTAHNRAALEALAGGRAGTALGGCAGVRATMPDRLPCVGPIVNPGAEPPRDAGLSVLTGLGSRGIVTSAFCARLLADYLCGDASGLGAWHDLLDPQRFVKGTH